MSGPAENGLRLPEETPAPEPRLPEEAAPEETAPEETVPEEAVPEEAVAAARVLPDEVPAEEVPEDTGPVRSYLLGTAAFLLIVVTSVVVAGAVSLQGLIRQEETARSAWGDVVEVMNTRLDLLEECFTRVGWIRQPPRVMRDYRRALEATDTAEGMTGEVEATRELDAAAAVVLLALRSEVRERFSGNGNLAALLERLEETELLRVTAGERYDAEVHTYRLRLERIPTRWIGWLFAFTELPYYLETEGARTPTGTSY